MQHAFVRIVYPWTCKAAQDDLATAVQGTLNDLAASPSVDATTRADFQTWASRLQTFLSGDPGWFGLGSRMDQIETYAQELHNWQVTLTNAGATVNGTIPDPFEPSAQDKWYLQVLQWGVVGVGILAGAYVVSEVVQRIPLPSPAEREREHEHERRLGQA